MAANDEDEIAAYAFGCGDECCEGGGVRGLARRIKQNFAGGRVLGPNIDALGSNFAHLRSAVPGDTFHKIGGHGISVWVLGAANKVKIQFHADALRGRNFQRLGAAPETFQTVVFAGLRGKDVDQQVSVISQHPFRLAVALHAGR